jgi:hypothetical protein
MTEENKQNNVSEEYKYIASMINLIHLRLDIVNKNLTLINERVTRELDTKKISVWCLYSALMALFATLLVPIVKLTMMFI